jgi:hypothetical protein
MLRFLRLSTKTVSPTKGSPTLCPRLLAFQLWLRQLPWSPLRPAAPLVLKNRRKGVSNPVSPRLIRPPRSADGRMPPAKTSHFSTRLLSSCTARDAYRHGPELARLKLIERAAGLDAVLRWSGETVGSDLLARADLIRAQRLRIIVANYLPCGLAALALSFGLAGLAHWRKDT